MMTSIPIADNFAQYVDAIRKTRDRDQPERQIVMIFNDFLTRTFGLETPDIQFEKMIYMAQVKRRGYLDALFGDLVFEFKRQITRDNATYREQLRSYLIQLEAEGGGAGAATGAGGRKYTGLLTDGLKFEAYTLNGDQLQQTGKFDLETLDAETAFARLDAYLFSQTNKPPTAIDVVERFGSNSPTFFEASRTLRKLLQQVDQSPMLATWRLQWRRLLSKVYGSDVASDELFLRHTYLCQFARLLGYAALRGLPNDDHTVRQIVTGEAFAGQGVSNIAENDFFAWVLMKPIQDEALRMLRRLSEGLIVYDLSRIDQDLLKQLYQNLVDPETRHELGEYYTPDWLAELTLEDIGYQPGQSLLDPTCGSGSFLFSAIKRLAAQGLNGWALVDFAVNNVMGTDVHPLAVTVARINYLLALAEHMQTPRAGKSALLTLPVYMADALVSPVDGRGEKDLVIPVDEARDERFFIPKGAAAAAGALTELIGQMERFARRGAVPYVASFGKLVQTTFTKAGHTVDETALATWGKNLRLLTRLIQEDRNAIWSYILTNAARPLMLAQRGFDVVAGNPPWLSYRFVKSRDYQREVKRLYQHYGLIESGDVKLFTQMDLSTLFFAHARDVYLKPGGTLAFVMPRAVITGAKQHRPFQTTLGEHVRVLDLLGVQPLFNVPTCVVILNPIPGAPARPEGAKPPPQPAHVPGVAWKGRLPQHEMSLDDARPYLTHQPTTVRFVDSEVRGRYYYERFEQGATLVPRNLCFVKPEGNPNSPAVITDPDADKEAKVPYKGISLSGVVDDDYLYATLLSKHLIPFGYEKLHLVALPARLGEDGHPVMLTGEGDFAEHGHFASWDWFSQAEAKWSSLKKSTSKMSLSDRYDYQRFLSKQAPSLPFKVIYNKSGTHLSASVFATESLSTVHQRSVQGILVDFTTYFYDATNETEAHYLCAFLNAPSVDKAIKAYQTRGIFKGERDITRLPFEACEIPPFDPSDEIHLALAQLSQDAHEAIRMLKLGGGLKGSVYAIRKQARAAVAAQLAAIDALAKRVLGLA